MRITRSVEIPDDEIELRFVRAGGPGGQKVNTSSTKVELRFDLAGSPSLTEPLRERAAERLAGRLTQEGVLVLQASEHRTQGANRRAVLARFRDLLREALAPPPPPRRATAPSRAARERRMEGKRRRAETKRLRRPPS